MRRMSSPVAAMIAPVSCRDREALMHFCEPHATGEPIIVNGSAILVKDVPPASHPREKHKLRHFATHRKTAPLYTSQSGNGDSPRIALPGVCIIETCESGGIGRRTRLRIWRGNPWGFESPLSHQLVATSLALFILPDP